MSTDTFFDQASSIMTVLSFLCFLGIIAWAYSARRRSDFAQAEQLPFADEETHHG